MKQAIFAAVLVGLSSGTAWADPDTDAANKDIATLKQEIEALKAVANKQQAEIQALQAEKPITFHFQNAHAYSPSDLQNRIAAQCRNIQQRGFRVIQTEPGPSGSVIPLEFDCVHVNPLP